MFFPFVDHVVQEVDSRFSQHHQGLILADRLSMAMSIDTRDQIEILKYYKKFLTLQESFYFSVEIQKWKKYYENIPFEERPATANSALAVCNLQTFPAIHKTLTILLTIPLGSVSCERSFSALRRGTLEWLRDVPYSSWDGLNTGTWGDLPNETKLVEVNEPGFVLTEFRV